MICDYILESGGYPTILLRWRDEQGKRLEKRVVGFEPYYFSGSKKPTQYKGFLGNYIEKHVVKKPGDVPIQSARYADVYENNVLFTDRYLIDNIKEIPKWTPRIFYMDIEQNKLSVEGYSPIEIIGWYDSFEKKYTTFTTLKVVDKETTNVHYFKTEKDMLNQLIQVIRKEDPDILTGWNFTNYDIPVIIKRMNMLKINYKQLSPYDKVKLNLPDDRPIGGRIVFDLLNGYKKVNFLKTLDSHGLDYVSQEEGFGGKMEIAWEDATPDHKVAYNRVDVKRTVQIDSKRKIIDSHMGFQRVAGCTFETYWNSKLVDTLCLREAHTKGIYLSGRREKIEEENTSTKKGGYVMKPEPGIYKDVVVVDISQQYVSIIIDMNVSPETKRLAEPSDTENYHRVDLDDRIIWFKKEPKGVLSGATEKIRNRRLELKSQIKTEKDPDVKESLKGLDFATKTIGNSFYGATLYPSFRLYDPDVGEAILTTARNRTKGLHKALREAGFSVIYGDTDSAFIENAFDKIDKIKEVTSEYLKQFKLGFKVEYEFEHVMFRGPKRYAGWDRLTDDMVIIGFDAIRANTPKYCRETLKVILERILKGAQREDILKYMEERVGGFPKADIKETAISTALHKDITEYKVNRENIRAAVYSNKNLEKNYSKGSRFYLHRVIHSETDVIAFDYASDLRDYIIDYSRIIEVELIGKVEKLFESLGWSFKDEVDNWEDWI